MRILALDWGQVRVGAAVSDPDGRIAFPLDKFIENESASDEIKKIIIDLKVEKIVIGLPKTLAGEPGASAEKVKAFVDNIQGQVSCKFEFLDERFTSVEAAMLRAGEMLLDGADILEIGGESTGPTSQEVSLDEELSRVIPVVRGIKEAFPDAKISVDTWKALVAIEALKENVMMINDVTAGRGSDGEMFDVLKDSSAQLVLMYAKDSSARTTIQDEHYNDVVLTVREFLSARKGAAIAAGIDPAKIILDPGLGHFLSSDAKYSFQVLARLKEFLSLDSPLFVSPSRKSFLAGPEKLPTAERLPGTIAASVVALQNGATYIRTHDVLEVRRACEIAELFRI